MKRIIDGVTYNTETATRIALKEEKTYGGTSHEEMYVTRGCAFFMVVKYPDDPKDDRVRIYPRRRGEVGDSRARADAHLTLPIAARRVPSLSALKGGEGKPYLTFQFLTDGLQNTGHIVHHVAVPEAEYPIATMCQLPCPQRVLLLI